MWNLLDAVKAAVAVTVIPLVLGLIEYATLSVSFCATHTGAFA